MVFCCQILVLSTFVLFANQTLWVLAARPLARSACCGGRTCARHTAKCSSPATQILRVQFFCIELPSSSGQSNQGACTVPAGAEQIILRASGLSCSSVGVSCAYVANVCRVTEIPFLEIQGFVSFEQLELAALARVAGSISIANTSLIGVSFPVLRTVSGNVTVAENLRLLSFTAPSLYRVGGDSVFFNNLALQNLVAPTTVGRSALVFGNQALKSLSGFSQVQLDFVIGNSPALTSVVSDVETVSGSLFVFGIGTDRFPLAGLKEVGGDLLVAGNKRISSVQLPLLSIVNGSMFIFNTSATTLSTPLLVRVGGDIQLASNDLLGMIDFPELRYAGALFVSLNNRLSSAKLDRLVSVDGDVVVSQNSVLKDLFVSTLSSIGGTMQLHGNRALGNVSFPSLSSAQQIVLTNNTVRSLKLPQLKSVAQLVMLFGNLGLEVVAAPILSEIGSNLFVLANPNLTDVHMPSLSKVNGSGAFYLNPLLGNVSFSDSSFRFNFTVRNNALISSLNAPRFVGRSLGVLSNRNLVSFSSPSIVLRDVVVAGNRLLSQVTFRSLSTVAGSLKVSDNARLANVQLSHLVAVGENMNITSAAADVHLESLRAVGVDARDPQVQNQIALGNGTLYACLDAVEWIPARPNISAARIVC